MCSQLAQHSAQLVCFIVVPFEFTSLQHKPATSPHAKTPGQLTTCLWTIGTVRLLEHGVAKAPPLGEDAQS